MKPQDGGRSHLDQFLNVISVQRLRLEQRKKQNLGRFPSSIPDRVKL
jgi:hypothetical protein